MIVQVKNYVRNCIICKESKSWNLSIKTEISKEVVTTRPFQKLYVDFIGKCPRSIMGNAYIFIVGGQLTKFVFLKAMKEATPINVIRFLTERVFHNFGVPEVIHSDNGKQFVAKEYKKMLQDYDIIHIRTAVHSPQSNASERVNQSVLAAIRAYMENDHRDWDSLGHRG